jgi:site-specific DNA-methyltransferase (adenine-specific)
MQIGDRILWRMKESLDAANMLRAKSSEWETPFEFFSKLNDEFHFTLDPCATAQNAKCPKFYTKEEDGLAQSWENERVFMNPPYGAEVANWIAKAYFERDRAEVIVALLPVRTDTRWFHDFVIGKAEIWFVKGRLKFVGPKGIPGTATFPSMVVVWRRSSSRTPRYLSVPSGRQQNADQERLT